MIVLPLHPSSYSKTESFILVARDAAFTVMPCPHDRAVYSVPFRGRIHSNLPIFLGESQQASLYVPG